MRVLLDVHLPDEPFNAAVRDGTVGTKLTKILDTIKPEATYFTEHDGHRAALLVVDLPDPSHMPFLAEPWFLTFQADVHFRVAMTPDDLKSANLDQFRRQWA